jgi:hypothetical protein
MHTHELTVTRRFAVYHKQQHVAEIIALTQAREVDALDAKMARITAAQQQIFRVDHSKFK